MKPPVSVAVPNEGLSSILAIDDTEINLDLIQSALKGKYEIHLASSAQIALEKLSQVRVDLILLDVIMPKMDGFELCKVLKNDIRYADIPILFLTAKTDEESISQGFALGASDYITKPFRFSEIIARIDNHLELKSARDHLRNNLDQLISQRKLEKLGESNERLLNERKLLQSQKMEAIGLLAGGIAHDFNNQLTGIMGATELLSMSTKGTELASFTDIIMRSSKSASDLIKRLVLFTQGGSELKAEMDLKKSLKTVSDILKHSLDKKVSLKLELMPEDAPCYGSYSDLENIFLNIAINGAQAMSGSSGQLSLSLDKKHLNEGFCKQSIYEIEPGEFYNISIQDEGGGIDPETLNKIFDPFYTTKRREGGSGMGLSQVYSILKNHNSAIDVESVTGRGACFNIYIPVMDKEKVIADDSKVDVVRAENKARIMLVDDDDRVLDVGSTILKQSGFLVDSFKDCDEAIDFYNDSHELIDLVLLDFIMPKMNGLELYECLKRINPHLRVLMITGYNETNIDQCLDAGINRFMFKPYSVSELVDSVNKTLNLTESEL